MNSSKIKLNKVTLVGVTGKDNETLQEALNKSSEGIDFGATKLVFSDQIKTIDDWNYFIIYRLHHYIDTEFALLIHPDGYVIHPELWRNEWLNYDYIGAPWPLPVDNFSYRDVNGDVIRVGNSVSLRSKKLMQLADRTHMIWEPFHGYYNEDGFICVNNRHQYLKAGMKFAPLEVAVHFSKEHEIPENVGLETFAFHHVD